MLCIVVSTTNVIAKPIPNDKVSDIYLFVVVSNFSLLLNVPSGCSPPTTGILSLTTADTRPPLFEGTGSRVVNFYKA
jgi:hypothetical protein